MPLIISRCLKPDMGKKAKCKTQIKKKTLNPEYNEVGAKLQHFKKEIIQFIKKPV